MANKSTVAVALAENLSRLMEQHGLTQEQVGRKAGIAQRTISTLLNVQSPATTNPRAETIDAIARVFHVPPWQLLIPEIPLDLLASPRFSALIENYRDAQPEGRETLDRIAESEVRYTNLQQQAKRSG